MSTAVTQAQAEAKIAFYLDLEEQVAAGQSVGYGDRTLTRANLSEISRRLQYWIGVRDQLAAKTRGQARRVAFSDWEPK